MKRAYLPVALGCLLLVACGGSDLKGKSKDYTTDGAAPDLTDPTKTNAYATFSLTPGGT